MNRQQAKTPYWEFKALEDNTAELYLYREIAPWGEGNYADSAKSFKRDLDALGEPSELHIYINSPGGDVFEGHAIYNIIKRAKCRKITHVDGVAASIAFEIMLAGDEIIMPQNAMGMIHNAWGIQGGTAADLRKYADALDKVSASYRAVCMSRTNLAEQQLTDMMDAETWLSADDCLKYGFCDEVTPAKQISASIPPDIAARYRSTPKGLILPESPIGSAKDPAIECLISEVNALLENNQSILREEYE